LINEENEILREGYMDILSELKALYNSGDLILNKKVLEKLKLYLQKEKVLLAGGIDPNHIKKDLEELKKKRNLRIKINKETIKQFD